MVIELRILAVCSRILRSTGKRTSDDSHGWRRDCTCTCADRLTQTSWTINYGIVCGA